MYDIPDALYSWSLLLFMSVVWGVKWPEIWVHNYLVCCIGIYIGYAWSSCSGLEDFICACLSITNLPFKVLAVLSFCPIHYSIHILCRSHVLRTIVQTCTTCNYVSYHCLYVCVHDTMDSLINDSGINCPLKSITSIHNNVTHEYCHRKIAWRCSIHVYNNNHIIYTYRCARYGWMASATSCMWMYMLRSWGR